jgi:hypothetical protein
MFGASLEVGAWTLGAFLKLGAFAPSFVPPAVRAAPSQRDGLTLRKKRRSLHQRTPFCKTDRPSGYGSTRRKNLAGVVVTGTTAVLTPFVTPTGTDRLLQPTEVTTEFDCK